MDNSRSLEALYQDGTGMVSLPKKSYKASIEGYDGFDDILSIDLAKSEENLAFLDTYQLIEAKNAADKIKMCKKLSANYGTRSGIPTAAATSVESLCHMMSLEANDDANAAAVNTGNEESVNKPETEKKKVGFLKTIFKNIGKFFSFIAKMFKSIGSKIASIFKKEETVAPTTAPSPTVDMNIGNNPSTDENANTKSSAGGFKMPEILVDLRTLNISGMSKFCQQYTQVAQASLKLKNISLEKGTKAGDDFDKALKDDVTPRAAKLIVAAGFPKPINTDKLTSTVNSKDHFRQLEKQLGAAKDKDAIEKMMSYLFGVSIMKKAEDWNKAASSKDFTAKCENFAKDMEKLTSDFSKSADIFNDVADTLADKVDSLVSQRQTPVKGTDGNEYSTWSNNAKQQGENKMNKVESSLAICASMLKFNAKIGKTIIDITTKIQSTMVAAKNHRKAINAGAQAAMQSARNAAK